MTVGFEWPALAGTALAEHHGLFIDDENPSCGGAYTMPPAPISGLDTFLLKIPGSTDVSIRGTTSYKVLGTCPEPHVTLNIDFVIDSSGAREDFEVHIFWFVL